MKVLISFLGTGPIDPRSGQMTRNNSVADYKIGEQTISSKFVTSVLKKLTQVDKVIIFGTVKSMWEVLYEYICTENDMDTDQEIAYSLFEMSDSGNAATDISGLPKDNLRLFSKYGWEPHLIYYGLNNIQIEKNFKIFADALSTLPKKSTIYLDITHSFRSLPIMAVSAVDYLNTVSGKNFTIESIYYGMLDVSRELGYTPVIKLDYILQLQQWAKGGYAFLEYGDTDMIRDLLSKSNKNAAQRLKEFADTLSMNYIHEIDQQLNNLRSLTESKGYSELEKMIVPQIFKNFLKRFDSKTMLSELQLELAKWHFEKKNYALSYLCLVESMVTYVCEQNNLPTSGEEYRNNAKDKINRDKRLRPIKDIWAPANQIRKNTAHVLEKSKNRSVTAIAELKKFIEGFEHIAKS
jgi:CRISPR-associated Csx2 family protein